MHQYRFRSDKPPTSANSLISVFHFDASSSTLSCIILNTHGLAGASSATLQLPAFGTLHCVSRSAIQLNCSCRKRSLFLPSLNFFVYIASIRASHSARSASAQIKRSIGSFCVVQLMPLLGCSWALGFKFVDRTSVDADGFSASTPFGPSGASCVTGSCGTVSTAAGGLGCGSGPCAAGCGLSAVAQ